MLNNSSELVVCLFGTPNFKWQGEVIKLPTRKTTALLCHLAVEQRAVKRKELTELLWKPAESRNLGENYTVLNNFPVQRVGWKSVTVYLFRQQRI